MLEGVSINHSTLLNTDNWKRANQQYFKCLAMMQQLRQVSLKFNKDLGLEEVSSYLFLVSGVIDQHISVLYLCFEQPTG